MRIPQIGEERRHRRGAQSIMSALVVGLVCGQYCARGEKTSVAPTWSEGHVVAGVESDATNCGGCVFSLVVWPQKWDVPTNRNEWLVPLIALKVKNCGTRARPLVIFGVPYLEMSRGDGGEIAPSVETSFDLPGKEDVRWLAPGKTEFIPLDVRCNYVNGTISVQDSLPSPTELEIRNLSAGKYHISVRFAWDEASITEERQRQMEIYNSAVWTGSVRTVSVPVFVTPAGTNAHEGGKSK
jgi:hypothetical protein